MNILLFLIFNCAITPIHSGKKILEIRNLRKYIDSINNIQKHYRHCLTEIEKLCTESTGRINVEMVIKHISKIRNYLIKINKIEIIKEFIIKEMKILLRQRISLIVFYFHNGLIVKVKKIVYHNEADGDNVTTKRTIIEGSLEVLEKYNDTIGTIYGDIDIPQITEECITQ